MTKRCPYDEKYYRTYRSKANIPYDRSQERWMNLFRGIAKKIVANLSPRTTFEFGCAKGFLVETLRDLGVDAEGIDISEFAINQVREDVKSFCYVGSMADRLTCAKHLFYDLVICVEVMEHLTPSDGEKAIQNLVQISDTILFSSTPTDFDEPTHINVQPAEYWIKLFNRYGFEVDSNFDASFAAPHALLMRRRQVLKVLSITNGFKASTQIRIINPLNILARHELLQHRIVIASKKRLFDMKHIHWADVIIFQRLRHRQWLKVLIYAQQSNKVTIFEIDDNLLEIPPGHPEYGFLNKIKYKQYLRFIELADGVTVSTEELYRYFLKYNNKTFLLPNYIDSEMCNWEIPQIQDRSCLTIGYAGSKSHKMDLAIVVDAIKKIICEFANKIRFKFLGYIPPELIENSHVQFMDQIPDYRTYLYYLRTSEFDFAIAPLTANLFNQCKSNIKFLEYSICGIPGIYSNVKPYADSVEDGKTGIIVKRDSIDDWYNAMKCLILDKHLREAIRLNCYERVKNDWLLQDNVVKWLKVYEDLSSEKTHRKG